MNTCVEHHSKELYIENEEERFRRTQLGCTDTAERKKKRRKKFEQDFLKGVADQRKYIGRNTDQDIVQNYKNFTAEM